jgi:hypothetical protein
LAPQSNSCTSNTILRISYARTLESPFNENLVIASIGCSIPFLAALVPPPGVPCNSGPVTPGFRNEFHSGLEQAFGKYLVFSGEYIWKYTHNGYDFGVVGSTSITFPIEWHNSKIPGYARPSEFSSTLIKVPAPNTKNDDHNPQRIQPRSLFDVSLGDDNLLKGEKYKWSLRLTAINVASKYALYNFLSTFSGTHYVTPRAMTAELGFHF